MAISDLIRRLRRPNAEEAEASNAYWRLVEPATLRLREVVTVWVDYSITERESERLANAAAVYRWELARLSASLDEIQVPAHATRPAKEIAAALADAVRGCQLLATGHRFHKSETVCEGQTLLVESVDRVDKAQRELAVAPSEPARTDAPLGVLATQQAGGPQA